VASAACYRGDFCLRFEVHFITAPSILAGAISIAIELQSLIATRAVQAGRRRIVIGNSRQANVSKCRRQRQVNNAAMPAVTIPNAR
jgi:hypothetical protein